MIACISSRTDWPQSTSIGNYGGIGGNGIYQMQSDVNQVVQELPVFNWGLSQVPNYEDAYRVSSHTGA